MYNYSTVNSRYNNPRGEIEKSSLYRKFSKFKILASNIRFSSESVACIEQG